MIATTFADGLLDRRSWRHVTIGEICTKPQYGWTTKATTVGTNVRLLRTTDITSGSIDWDTVPRCSEEPPDVSRYLLSAGDIVISRAGSVGVSHLVTTVQPSVFASYLIRFRPGPDVLPKYLACFLQSAAYWKQIEDNTAGIAIPNVNASKLQDVRLPLAPLDEQHRIVAEIEKQFSRLDEAVANLRRVKANLNRYANGVLTVALCNTLRQGADHADLNRPTSADPDQAHPEMAPAIVLPVGWHWQTAADVCEVVASGSTPKPSEMNAGSGDVPFIKVYNLTFDGSLDFTIKPTFISRQIHTGQLARSRCLPGDVLVNIVGPPLGKVSIVPDDYPEWNINQAVVTFRAGSKIVNRLLAYWLMSPPVQERIEKTSKATAGQFNVQVTTCRKLVLPVPPLLEQRRIVAEVDRRLSIVREVEAEVDANLMRAQVLRQAVLGAAFSSGS